MKRPISAATIALGVLALLGLAGSALAQHPVPFKGRLEGVNTRTLLAPPFALDTLAISGNATHLGKYDLVILATVNLTTKTAAGSYVFEAANGDILTASFVGKSAPTATPGVILITEIAIITGGTGRFTDASGEFICERLFTPATGETIGSFAGIISTR